MFFNNTKPKTLESTLATAMVADAFQNRHTGATAGIITKRFASLIDVNESEIQAVVQKES